MRLQCIDTGTTGKNGFEVMSFEFLALVFFSWNVEGGHKEGVSDFCNFCLS
jgi:hypothetical protein